VETADEATAIIYREITTDDINVRTDYLTHFDKQAKAFSAAMAQAVVSWKELDSSIDGNENRAVVSALVHAAITLHIVSCKLMLSGHVVAAGNMFRQVIETIAVALLCSSHELPVLKKFKDGQYSSSKAVRDVVRHWEKLDLIKEAHQQLEKSQEFYGQYSHVTRLTLAHFMSFSAPEVYVGAAFDPKKLDAYSKELDGRVRLAEVFENFIAAVKQNVGKWP
jgi:hypothetical protein